mgnify:CR=1 FL=1|jgi:hypothetical protein
MVKSTEKAEEKELSPQQALEWNLASNFINEIAYLLMGASNSAIEGNAIQEYKFLRQIRARIVPIINSDEFSMCCQLEKFISNGIYLLDSFNFSNISAVEKENKEFLKNRSELRSFSVNKLCEYNDYLLKLLKKYGLFIPTKRDRTKI